MLQYYTRRLLNYNFQRNGLITIAMALLPRQSIEYQEAHPEEDQTRNLGGFYIVLVLISASCMFLRVFSRRITQLAFDAGLGKHWALLTPDQMILFPKLNYAFNILNLACYPIIKISILLLYLRIFVTNRIHMLSWGGIIFLSCMCIANTLVAMFACTPVRGFFDSSVPAMCIDDVKFYWCTAILNVVTDLYILILPIPVVWKLQTTLKRKIAISLIFTIGGL
ncbi:hypothetical protein SLS62_001752 [Diatrype stigma]|uniref:Rhodopsin domain-containing protein n=1 Tax=Diatrype stigma TaxID=117547 RepID=A0AAN9V175_9PEZI